MGSRPEILHCYPTSFAIVFIVVMLTMTSGDITGLQRAEASDSVERKTPIPNVAREVLQNYCVECHNTDLQEGDVQLDTDSVDWSNQTSQKLWQKVLSHSQRSVMPPYDSDQPDRGEKKILADWIDRELSAQISFGGTRPRRLNQNEYLNTVRELLYMRDYQLPPGFPGDSEVHGFDNLGEGLVMSPSHLAAYSAVATELADLLYPQPKKSIDSKIQVGGVEDLVLSFSASSIKNGRLRLASKAKDIMRSCTWPQQHQAKVSGVYQITVDGSVFKPREGDLPMVLEVRARQVSASERSEIGQFRFLKDLPYTSTEIQSHTFEAELYAGETLSFRWKNAEFDHNDLRSTVELMRDWFERDPRWLAAWQQAVFPNGLKKGTNISTLRGLNGWNSVNQAWSDPNLDMSQATMDSKITKELLRIFGTVGGGTFNLGDALCHYYFNHGPSLEIQGYTIEGPSKLVDSDMDKRYKQIARQVAGVDLGDLTNEQYARKMLENFLPRAFRRPVDSETVDAYLSIALEHWGSGYSLNEGMHLLMRNILISPQFLYRSLEPGKLDDRDLATRLAYFFTQGPPDGQLTELANAGRLSNLETLRGQAERLMPTKRQDPLVTSFTGQWLDTRRLPSIMPDPQFKFTEREVNIAKSEVELFFTEMIKENRPMRDFIDPDFVWTAPYFAERFYQMKGIKGRGDQPKRISIERGGKFGGLLGISAVMMVTANGVDTQPVLRGAWVLENIVGMTPPEPPEDVPALTPDTQGTITPRQMLEAHTQDSTCANCHRYLDPFGFALENFDPVGKWRETWPGSERVIDSSVVLPDGTQVRDVVDLKNWLVSHEQWFSQNVAEKLMVYGAGRTLNYAEKKEIAEIVGQNRAKGGGFRDLILDLVQSQTFMTK